MRVRALLSPEILRVGAVKGLSNMILYGQSTRTVRQTETDRDIYILYRRFCFIEMYVNVDLVKLFVRRSEFNSS